MSLVKDNQKSYHIISSYYSTFIAHYQTKKYSILKFKVDLLIKT